MASGAGSIHESMTNIGVIDEHPIAHRNVSRVTGGTGLSTWLIGRSQSASRPASNQLQLLGQALAVELQKRHNSPINLIKATAN
jgi:hypothetical protein